jgi:hypothetical protein
MGRLEIDFLTDYEDASVLAELRKRDHFACVRCGASGVGVRLESDHRFPFAKERER